MTIILKYMKILPTGEITHGRTLKMWDEDDKVSFDPHNRMEVCERLQKLEKKIKKMKGVKVAFRMYKFGGKYHCYFPGYHKGKKIKPVNYFGVPENFMKFARDENIKS